MNKTHAFEGWSICLAADWPKIVEAEDILGEKRVTFQPDEVIALAQMCQQLG